jgi:transposase
MKSVDDLRDENARLTSTVTALETRIIALESEIEVWKRRLFGQKAERVKNNEAQASLFALLEQMGRLAAGDLAAGEVADELISDLRDEAASPSSPSPSPSPSPSRGEKRKGTAGRRKLSESDLPVHRIVLNPIGYTGGADDELVKVGEEISRHVDYQPGSHVVVEVVRPKCIKKADAGTSSSSSSSSEPAVEFFIADAAELPISKGLAGPGLLANVLVRKYADHLPLHRQERILLREGIRFGRSTLCG